MTKTIKIQLLSKNDDILDYRTVNKLLWQLQKETRVAANRCIQLCWEYSNFESDWKKRVGEYPTYNESREILEKSLQSVIYNRIKQDTPTMNTANLCMVIQSVYGKFNHMKSDILRGDVSIPSYKKDIPIELNKNNIILDYTANKSSGVQEWLVKLTLFSQIAKKDHNLASTALQFKAILPAKAAKSVRAILERCYDEEYHIAGSKLQYDNGKWFLLLCYSFDKAKDIPNFTHSTNIMGVHIAKHNAVTCFYSNSKKVDKIAGGEVLAFSQQIENRRRSIGMASKKHSSLCGDGRVGHGYHAKMKPLEHISDKITNFRNTTNHRYSRQIVNWAVKNKCGTIQIEDLTGLASDDQKQYTLLQNWSYFDLITKIEYKAKEYGITVIKIGYKDLRKWCPDCHDFTIEHKNALEADVYTCTKCGQVFMSDTDFERNAQNALVTPSIDKIVQSTKPKKDKQS